MLERKHIEAAIACARDLESAYWPAGYSDSAITEMRKHLDAALAACDESPWRTMDSAPKDGTDILLLVDGAAHEGGWVDGESHGIPSEEYYGWWNTTGSDAEPTHWMPLPAAPEVG